MGVHGDCPAGFLSQCTPLVIMSSVPGRHFVPKYTFRGHDPSASRGPVPKYTSLYTVMILFFVVVVVVVVYGCVADAVTTP